MTQTTEEKAQAMVNACGGDVLVIIRNGNAWVEALCRAIEQQENLATALGATAAACADHLKTIAQLRAEIEALRQPKAITVTVVSAYDGSPMHTFTIDLTKKTIVRPEHSLFGYVFEPEGSHADEN